MATVTVAGGNGVEYRLNYGLSPGDAVSQLAAAINEQVARGNVSSQMYHGGLQPPATPAGRVGLAVFPGINNQVNLTLAEKIVLVNGGGPNTIAGGGGTGQQVLADDGDLTYFTGGGSGTIATGNGRNVIGSTSGSFNITTGSGDDTILGLGGTVTATGGTGHNVMFTGTGQTSYVARGDDTVLGVGDTTGLGSDTVGVEASQSLRIAHNANSLTFVNGGGSSTVYGGFGSSGTGSATVFGGRGGGIFQGGKTGHNVLLGQEGTVTLFGGGEADLLYVAGTGTNLLVAGTGNETLLGAANSGGSYYFAGNNSASAAANTQIAAGNNADSVIAGTGNLTVDGGLGADLFVFANGQAGGSTVIDGFRQGEGDRVTLVRYEAGELDRALSRAQVANGNMTLTLSDNTRITFSGVSGLSSESFI